MTKKLLLIPCTALFIGCVQPEPQAKNQQLELDKQELMALNVSYQTKEIDALHYLKQSRVLKEKIHKQEELLDTHDHMH